MSEKLIDQDSMDTLSQNIVETIVEQYLRNPEDGLSSETKVQEMSIQWLDIGRVKDYIKTNQLEIPAEEMIDRIIKKFNESEKNEKNDQAEYVLSEKYYPVNDYKLRTFYYCDEKTSNLSRELLSNPVCKTDTRFILFFYKEVGPRPRIFAVTTDKAYLVVRSCIDYDFPIKVAKKIGNPKTIDRKANRCLFGENIRENLHIRNPDLEGTKISKLYLLVESFKCEIKCGSSLSSLKIFKNNMIMPRIKITTGGILRILREMPLRAYPSILNLFEKYFVGEETFNANGQREENDSGFEFLSFIYAAPDHCRKNLNNLLIEEILSRYQKDKNINSSFYLHPKFVEDFLSSDKKIEINIGVRARYKELESKPPKIEEIINMITEGKKDMELKVFKEKIINSKLRYYAKNNRGSTTVELLSCIEGEIVFEKNVYFKIRGMWYEVTTDFICLLIDDFRNVLQRSLVVRDDNVWLPKPYKITPPKPRGEKKSDEKSDDRRADEANYNKSYQSEPRYLCFDKVTPDGIEICDILKYNEKYIYLYHVKDVLGQNTRVACSQLLNSAKLIQSALKSNCEPQTILDKLWDAATAPAKNIQALKEEPFCNCKEKFIKFFLQRKIIFVYAYAPKSDKTFALELEKKRFVTREDLPVDPNDKDELFEMLITAGYIKQDGLVTGKSYSMTLGTFELDVGRFSSNKIKTKIFQHLKEHCPFTKSTIAMIELVQLEENLRKLSLDFKICEIDREELKEPSVDRKSKKCILSGDCVERGTCKSDEQNEPTPSTSRKPESKKQMQTKLISDVIEKSKKQIPSGDCVGSGTCKSDKQNERKPSTSVNPEFKRQACNSSKDNKSKEQSPIDDFCREVQLKLELNNLEADHK